jgi:alpha-L-fucosidase
LTELLTNYGKIDMVCLDMWLGKEVWPQMRDTLLTLRKIQPDVMFRARGIGNYGDYYTPEGYVPKGKGNTDMPWFVIYPLAENFAYDPKITDYKGGQWIVRTLVDTVAKGGNFMVGIGPDGNGRFAPVAIENLETAGDWLKVNGEGIYATRPREGDLWKEGKEIRYTQTKDHRIIYAFALSWPGPTLNLKTVHPQPSSNVHLLGYSAPLAWTYTAEGGTVVQLPAELQGTDKHKRFFVSGFKIEPQP